MAGGRRLDQSEMRIGLSALALGRQGLGLDQQGSQMAGIKL